MNLEKPIYKSNKFWLAIGGIVLILGLAFSNVSVEIIALVVGTIATLIHGIGQADKGKEAAKIKAESEFAGSEVGAETDE